MDRRPGGPPRTYIIRRSQHLGYGFVAGSELPTIVKSVDPNGPSFKRLMAGDIIMAVNGIEIETAPREKIIKMIQLSNDQIEIQVRQPTYDEFIQIKNLSNDHNHANNIINNNLTKSSNNLLNDHQNQLQQPFVFPPHSSPLNRLVTSIAQQQRFQSHNQHMNQFTNGSDDRPETPPVQINSSKAVLRQQQTNGNNRDENIKNYTQTLGRNNKNYGRHSPIPQRCKSSMDRGQNGKSSKNSGDLDNDQPLLKRSNTMRLPKNLPSKYVEIFEVVIKIFFEDDRTTVLNYNQDTTVGAILDTLNARLTGHSPDADQLKPYFGLALTMGDHLDHGLKEDSMKRKLHILDENYSIVKIGQLSYAPRLRLLYRMVCPPSDVDLLHKQSKIAFDYLYRQSCNDLKFDRFEPELDQDASMKLCAMHLLEYAHSHYSKSLGDSKDPKVYVRLIKKDIGIEKFLPASMLKGNVDKKGKILRGQYKKLKNRLLEQLKRNFEEFDLDPPKVRFTTNSNRYSSTSFHELSLPEVKTQPSDYIKLQFLNFLSQLPCYGNLKRSTKAATSSPNETYSADNCSSSLDSVPRTSDSSPLIKQDTSNRDRGVQCHQSVLENQTNNPLSRLAQMNSMRSLSSVQSSGVSQPLDQPDLAQTPSIESISSIAFNLQPSPSPQQAQLFNSLSQDHQLYPTGRVMTNIEPLPMPRQQVLANKMKDCNSVEQLYGQRYAFGGRPLEDLLRNVRLLPPPPPPSALGATLYPDISYHPRSDRKIDLMQVSYVTQVLTDKEIEKLRTPPPPRMIN